MSRSTLVYSERMTNSIRFADTTVATAEVVELTQGGTFGNSHPDVSALSSTHSCPVMSI